MRWRSRQALCGLLWEEVRPVLGAWNRRRRLKGPYSSVKVTVTFSVTLIAAVLSIARTSVSSTPARALTNAGPPDEPVEIHLRAPRLERVGR